MAAEQVAGVGPTVIAGLDRLQHRFRGHESGDRQAAAESLSDGEDVRKDAAVLAREPAAGAADARLDLVQDQ